MTSLPEDLSIAALRDPAAPLGWSLPRWDRLIRQARRAGVLARIAASLADRGLTDRVPAAPRAHLDATLHIARAQHDQVRREVRHIVQALQRVGVEPILLKGSAYLLADLPPAAGRLFSDIDILVPHARLPEVEAGLMMKGWATTHHSPYDQHYYRMWMHELPPMIHIHRETVLDVHHAILPRTARLKPDSAKLIAAALPVPGQPGVHMLAPVDMLLHSITHLVHNEELSHGLRDLSDIDLLLRHWGDAPGFWTELLLRARELGLGRPLHYGLACSARILGTPVPADVPAAARHVAPSAVQTAWMNALWVRALRSPHASAGDAWTPPARFALYLRAHWLRMPLWPLAKHLTVKALRRDPADDATGAAAAP